MTRDKRYTTIKKLLSTGQIDSFLEIFDTLPKSVVARDMGMNNARFTRLIENVEELKLKEIYRMASFLEVEDNVLYNIIYKKHKEDNKGKKKR